jgi:NAD(P)H dehydrogenase (quinone)
VGHLDHEEVKVGDEVFDNLPSIIGRKPRTLADFAKKHADVFRY